MGDLDAQCSFNVRTVITEDPPSYRYDTIRVAGWHGDGCLHTQHPPMVGDLIFLMDDFTKASGEYLVLERSWTHPGYGSVNWQSGKPRPTHGPLVAYIVERVEGMFRDEAPEGGVEK
jgi:hypothetical protein